MPSLFSPLNRQVIRQCCRVKCQYYVQHSEKEQDVKDDKLHERDPESDIAEIYKFLLRSY